MAVKNPNRRQELLDVAEALFYQHGYEQTSMQDISAKAGVTKGALYHHFKSKEEVLDAIVKSMMEQSIEQIRNIALEPSLNAIEKIKKIAGLSIDPKISRSDAPDSFKRVVQHQENALLFFKLRDEWLSKVVPEVANIIEQGNRDAMFDVAYPADTARIIVITISDSGDEMERIIAVESPSTVKEKLEQKQLAFQNICDALLGKSKN